MQGVAMALSFAILDGGHSRIILSMKQKVRKGIMKKGRNQGTHPDNAGNGDGGSKTG